MSSQSSSRTPSMLDAACASFVQDLAELSPTEATAWGIPGFDDQLQDFSPEYWERIAERTREMLADVDALDDDNDDDEGDDDSGFDDVDHVTAAVLRDRLTLQLELHHNGEFLRQLNNIASPVQIIRDTFSLMPTDTPEDIATIRARMSHIPAALAGYRESLAEAASQGKCAAVRQLNEVIEQCTDLADNQHSALLSFGVPADAPELVAAARAFEEMGDWLAEHLCAHAPHEDAVGRERYELFSQEFVGDRVDLDEAYEWGLAELQRITAEQETIARDLYGEGVGVRDAFARLNAEERYRIDGVDNLKAWMQDTADRAIADLDGTHFDIPEKIRRIECCIDPAGTGGIFYTPPSDDFQRPGRMWWSVPQGQHTFHTWQELTTVFHEGVPGHHLQIGQTMCNREQLNRWRRVACWNSGHGEGWALYAEQLMAELGYHEDPGTRMGLLDAQRLRAARVVLDIGVHLQKRIPEGTSTWDAPYARAFLRENTAMDDANLNFELNRYLGWPGQAPSYALGQKLWMELRRDAQAAGMSLPDFHREALSLGSIPMSVLRSALLDS